MACLSALDARVRDSGVRDRRAGYATAAAVVIAMGVGLLATAVTASALSEANLERALMKRSTDQRRLDSAQASALEALMLQPGDSRLLWRLQSDGAEVEILAEPESAKLDSRADEVATGLPLAQLGVTDPAALASALGEAKSRPRSGLFSLSMADAAPAWRRCAISLVSPYGRNAGQATATTAVRPTVAAFNRRAGQVWRVRTVLAGGVAEDRVVRFTGRPQGPVLILERRRQTGQAWGDPCTGLTVAS